MTAVTSSPPSHPKPQFSSTRSAAVPAGWPLAHHGSAALPNTMAELLSRSTPGQRCCSSSTALSQRNFQTGPPTGDEATFTTRKGERGKVCGGCSSHHQQRGCSLQRDVVHRPTSGRCQSMLSVQLSTNSTHRNLLIPTDLLVRKLNKASFYKTRNCSLKPANVSA